MDRKRVRMPANTSLLLTRIEDSLHVIVTHSDDLPLKLGGRSSWHPLGRPSQYAPRARTRISITAWLIILYALISVVGIFVLIMAQSGKSRSRNTHKYLFVATWGVIGRSRLSNLELTVLPVLRHFKLWSVLWESSIERTLVYALNPLRWKLISIIFKDPVRTAQ